MDSQYRITMAQLRGIRILMLCVCATFLSHNSLQAQPTRIESIDPLTRAAPAVEIEVDLLQAAQQPEEKIVPRLWRKISETNENDEIRIIVELQSPARGYAQVHNASDVDRVRVAAAIEHRFADKAKSLITDLRGLSHFPIVFGRARLDGIAKIAALPEVLRIYPDEPVEAFRSNGGALIGATSLRTLHGGSGANIGVAVLDSGIDSSHPELLGRVVAQADFTGTVASGEVDDNGHGTGVAGIIAGTGAGVAPQANLWAIKVLKGDGTDTSTSVIEGLNAIYASRGDFGGLHLVNLSLGSRGPYGSDCDGISPYNLILSQFFAVGISVIVASGNDGDLNGISHPACHSKVIAVGAVYDGNIGQAVFGNCNDPTTGADQIACYSNSGLPLDVLAPGHCAHTSQPGGGYDSCFGGTSAAAPYVAGVAAQLLQLHPGLTPAQLREVLMTTGKPITDVNGITRSRIDAMAAHQSLTGGSTEPCVEDATTACLLNDRFRATVRFRRGFDNNPVDAQAFRKPVTGFSSPTFETEFFFFGDPNNIEIVLKMLDQGNVNGAGQPTIAVLSGSATPLRAEVTITDTTNGVTRTYVSPFTSQKGETDFTAFVK